MSSILNCVHLAVILSNGAKNLKFCQTCSSLKVPCCEVQLCVFHTARKAADIERKARHGIHSSNTNTGCRHPSPGQCVARDSTREAMFLRFTIPKKIEGLPRSLKLLGSLIFITFVCFSLFFSSFFKIFFLSVACNRKIFQLWPCGV